MEPITNNEFLNSDLETEAWKKISILLGSMKNC